MNLTKTATKAFILILLPDDLWMTCLASLNNSLGAKGHTDAAGLAPGMIKRNIKEFLFLRRFFSGLLCTGLIFFALVFSHAVLRKTVIDWWQDYTCTRLLLLVASIIWTCRYPLFLTVKILSSDH